MWRLSLILAIAGAQDSLRPEINGPDQTPVRGGDQRLADGAIRGILNAMTTLYLPIPDLPYLGELNPARMSATQVQQVLNNIVPSITADGALRVPGLGLFSLDTQTNADNADIQGSSHNGYNYGPVRWQQINEPAPDWYDKPKMGSFNPANAYSQPAETYQFERQSYQWQEGRRGGFFPFDFLTSMPRAIGSMMETFASGGLDVTSRARGAPQFATQEEYGTTPSPGGLEPQDSESQDPRNGEYGTTPSPGGLEPQDSESQNPRNGEYGTTPSPGGLEPQDSESQNPRKREYGTTPSPGGLEPQDSESQDPRKREYGTTPSPGGLEPQDSGSRDPRNGEYGTTPSPGGLEPQDSESQDPSQQSPMGRRGRRGQAPIPIPQQTPSPRESTTSLVW